MPRPLDPGTGPVFSDGQPYDDTLDATAAGAGQNTWLSQRRFKMLSDQTPQLDESTRWKLASSQTPDAELMDLASAAVGEGEMRRSADQLGQQSHNVQVSIWSNMPAERQKLFLDAGYRDPTVQEAANTDKNWWQKGLENITAPVRAAWNGAWWGGTQALDKMANLADDVAGRPYRMEADQLAEPQIGRMELRLDEARRRLEDDGTRLTDEQWSYLKWRYLEQNPLEVRQIGETPGADRSRDRFMAMAQGTPLVGPLVGMTSEALGTDAVQGTPLEGLGDAVGTKHYRYNPYGSALGSTVPQDVYDRFRDQVTQLGSDPQYDMSAAAAWNRVDNGQTYVDPWLKLEMRDELDKLPPGGVDLAEWVAAGRDVDEWVDQREHIDPTDARYAQRVAELTSTYLAKPEFTTVVDAFAKDQSKVSVGRDYARTLGIDDTTPLYTMVSGATDAAWTMTMDPTLIAGHALKLGRAAEMLRYVEDIDAIEHLGRIKRGEAAADDILGLFGKETQATIRRAESVLATDARYAGLWDQAGLDAGPLFDEAGRATPLLRDNWDAVNKLVSDATAEGRGWAARPWNTGTRWADTAAAAQIQDVGQLEQAMQRSTLLADKSGLAGITARWRMAVADKSYAYAERVADAFEAHRVDPEGTALYDLYRDLPQGHYAVDAFKKWDEFLQGVNGVGITSPADVFDFYRTKGMWLLTDGTITGAPIRGAGHGMAIPDSMRLLGRGVDDVPLMPWNPEPPVGALGDGAARGEAVARGELFRLPTLGVGTKINRAFVNGVEDAMERAIGFQRDGGLLASAAGKPVRGTGKFLYGLTHHQPREALLALTGPEAIQEMERVVNMGVFGGLSAETRAKYMNDFIAGTATPTFVHYAGTEADRLTDMGLLQDLVSGEGRVGQQFVDRFGHGAELFDANGRGSTWLQGKYDDVREWVDDLTQADPSVVDDPQMEALNRLKMGRDASQVSVAGRTAALKGFLGELFDASGVRATEPGRQWADDFIGLLERGAYSVDQRDVVQVGSEKMRAGLFPVSHSSTQLQIPSFDDFTANARKVGIINRALGTVNNGIVDAFMGAYWKPAMLLRLGFVPRAFGEEALSFLAKQGGAVIPAYLANRVPSNTRGLAFDTLTRISRAPARAWGELYRAEGIDGFWKLAEMAPYRSRKAFMENLIRETPGLAGKELNAFDHVALFADYATARLMRSVRRAEYSMLPQHLKDAVGVFGVGTGEGEVLNALGLHFSDTAKRMMRIPYIQQAFADEIAQVGHTMADSWAGESFGKTIRSSSSRWLGRGETKFLPVAPMHAFGEHTVDGAVPDELIGKWNHQYSLAAADPVVAAILDAGVAGRIPESVVRRELARDLWGTKWSPPWVPSPDALAGAETARNGAETAVQGQRLWFRTTEEQRVALNRQLRSINEGRVAAADEVLQPEVFPQGLPQDVVPALDPNLAADEHLATTTAEGAQADALAADAAVPHDAPPDAPPVTSAEAPVLGPAHQPVSFDALAADLYRIASGQADPADTLFAHMADDGVARTVRDISDDVRTGAYPEWKPARPAPPGEPDTQTVVDALEGIRTGIRANWSDGDLRLLERSLMEPRSPAGRYRPRGARLSDPAIQRNLAAVDLEANYPRIAQRLSAAEMDSAPERLVASILTAPPKVARDRLDELELLWNMRSRNARVVMGDSPIRVLTATSRGADRDAMIAQAFAALQSEAVYPYTTRMLRGIYDPVTHAPIITPPAEGMRSLYSVMVDKGTYDHLAQLKGAGRDLDWIDQLRSAGATADQLQVASALMREWSTPLQEGLVGTKQLTAHGQMMPLGRVGFLNYDDAHAFNELIDRWTPVGTPEGSIKVNGLGHARMPDRYQYSTFDVPAPYVPIGGTHAVALDQGALTAMEPYTNRRLVRLNDAGIPDPAGQHVVEGATAESIYRQWATDLTDEVTRLYFNADKGEWLHELSETARGGMPAWDADGMASLYSVAPTELPKSAYFPEERVIPDKNVWGRMVERGFGEVINPAGYAMVRRPQFLLNFSEGLAAVRPAIAALRDEELYRAGQRALGNVGATLEDMRTAWHTLGEEITSHINSAEDFAKAVDHAAYLGRLDPEHPLVGLSHDTGRLDGIWQLARHDAYLDDAAAKAATHRAVQMTIPYIDDHATRSFFQGYARNVMPFEFAQEQFLKRWAKTAVYSPEAFRRAQLIAHGFMSSGFVQQDPATGQDVFVMPASEALGGILARTPVVNALYGGAAQVPISVPFTGEVRSMLPGIPGDLQNIPSLSPVAMVPLVALADHFPEALGGTPAARDALSAFTGGRAVDWQRGVLEQFLPPTAARVYSAVFDGGPNMAEMNAAAIGAVQQMEAEAIRLRTEAASKDAAGDTAAADELYVRAATLSLPDDANDHQKEAYIDNVREWARAQMMAKAVIGFVSPSTPKLAFENAGLAPEFQKLLTHMPFDEALGVFLAEHPSGQPYTIVTSTKGTDAPLPPTEQALAWMDAHRDVLEKYPKAGPWLMPQARQADEFSAQAYNDQIALGLRRKKSVDEWVADWKYASAASVYFPSKARSDAAIAQANPDEARALRDEWQQWSAQFKLRHPLFASQLTGEGRDRKEQALRELAVALDDPEMPDAGHNNELRLFVGAYASYKAERANLAGDQTKAGRASRNELDDSFLTWGEQMVTHYPTMRTIWQSVIVPATGLRAEAQARQHGGF